MYDRKRVREKKNNERKVTQDFHIFVSVGKYYCVKANVQFKIQ
jgi:hypothetical protein